MPVLAGFIHHQELVDSGLMARFICEVCGSEVDPKAASVLHLVTGWVRGGTNSLKKGNQTHHYRFVHDFCQRPANDDQLSLF